VPLTHVWARWWRRQSQRHASTPSLREAEAQRAATARQVAKELAAIVTSRRATRRRQRGQ
jgi:hypothetical protein